MKIIEYSPEWFGPLRHAVEPRRPESALVHRPFVDYYYASGRWCKLLLALDKNDGVVGTLGLDRMRFEYESSEMTLGFGSNYNSFLPGIGSFLFLRRLQECPLGLVFWSTEDTQKMIRSLGWTYFRNVRRLYLNYRYPAFQGEPIWRRAAKSLLRNLPQKRIGSYASRLEDAEKVGISVHPERAFSTDMLPRESPFTFRFAPSLDYLNWRYNTELSFVRYRLFRVLKEASTAGYVVIKETPDRLVVAQCDGEDPVSLAYGVMSSIVEVGRHDRIPRTVMLTTSHGMMRQLYLDFGFRTSRSDECFAVGGYKQDVALSPDTSSWHINFDWGNNELQTPFLDQAATASDSVENSRAPG